MTRAERPLVALVGNPNTGKSSIFNRLTGARVRVGNYPGITVERTVGRCRLPGGDVDVLDVPGAYSLVARSPDEQIAIDVVLGHGGNPRPDLVVAVVDATSVERNLYFVLQLLELELPMVVALNFSDAAEREGVRVEAEALSAALGVPVVPTVATRAGGVDALRAAITDGLRAPAHGRWLWTPDAALAADVERLVPLLDGLVADDASSGTRRAVALWALMSLDAEDELTGVPADLRLHALERQRAAREAGRDLDGEVVGARYAWIDAHSPEFVSRGARPRTLGERVDAVLLHPVAGFGVFIGLMALIFQALFSWSEPAIGWVEDTFAWLAATARAGLPGGVLTDFVVDALIGGVGNVLVFLPQIMLLFLFIGVMEDTGYLARAAFLMDRVMNRIGLHGRAFVPMLSAYACAVPAIMATRTMERRRDRYLTMMTLPLTTCSARLPVYTLLIGALIPATTVAGFFSAQSLVMVAMYLFGIAMALVAAAVLGRTVLGGERVPLILELPAYRRPDPRGVARLVWSRSSLFVREAGTVILVCTAVLWALLYFPRTSPEAEALAEQRPVAEAAGPAAVADLEARIEGAQKRNSYGGQLGRFIEPAIEPLGFDWKVGVGLVGAFAAREVFVSTMGVIYGVGDAATEDDPRLRARLKEERHDDGRRVYTPLMGLSLLVFFALACQCMSTLAAVKRETRSLRWPAFMFVYMTALAWVSSLAVYQGGRLLGLG